MQKILIAVIASAIVVAMLSAFGTLTAFAGQPNQSCQTVNSGTNQPGQTASSTGAPFNTATGGVAGGVYANNLGGSGQGSFHSGNLKSTSQYDVACAQNHSP